MTSIYVDEKTAASLLGYSTWTLGRWRTRGGGPPFIKVSGSNKVQYNREKLLAWMESQERQSTSEYPAWQRQPVSGARAS